MPWEKGQSGNPNGRPKKERALTAILEAQGNRTLEDIDGKRRGGKRIIARALWELATTGSVTLRRDDGTLITLDASPRDWIDTVKWLYQHIDGSAPKPIHLSGKGGGPIEINDVSLTDEERATRTLALLDAARAKRDSTSS